jgi:hypothetical protein
MSVVVAGLDPAIHRLGKSMDARVKPAHGSLDRMSFLSGLR